MNPQLRAAMLDWLESGTEAQKRHAAYRLSLPDATGAAPSPPSVPRVIPDRPPPGTGIPLGGCCGG
jgi:hypothetical protein